MRDTSGRKESEIFGTLPLPSFCKVVKPIVCLQLDGPAFDHIFMIYVN